MAPKIVAMVPARSGSAGLPDKNIRLLNGVPLIGHSLRPALDCPQIAQTYFNSDSESYLEIGHSFGARTYQRPPHLGEAETTMQAVVADFISSVRESGENLDAVLVLYPTFPFRSVSNLSAIVERYLAEGDCDSLIGMVAPATHPYLCATLTDRGRVKTFLEYDVNKYYRRQDYPKCYKFSAWALIINADRINNLNAQLMSDNTAGYVVPPEINVIDIDGELDFAFAEYLLEKGIAESQVHGAKK